jgi:hypothetical protein
LRVSPGGSKIQRNDEARDQYRRPNTRASSHKFAKLLRESHGTISGTHDGALTGVNAEDGHYRIIFNCLPSASVRYRGSSYQIGRRKQRIEGNYSVGGCLEK